MGQKGEVFSAKLKPLSGFGMKGEVSMNLFLKSGKRYSAVNIDGECPVKVRKGTNSPVIFKFIAPATGTYHVVIAGSEGVQGSFSLTILSRFGIHYISRSYSLFDDSSPYFIHG